MGYSFWFSAGHSFQLFRISFPHLAAKRAMLREWQKRSTTRLPEPVQWHCLPLQGAEGSFAALRAVGWTTEFGLGR